MLHLLQIYNIVEDKKFFIQVFSDLEFELEELGYKDFPEELINELLLNHFGLTIEDDRQLAKITETILKKKDLSFLAMLP